MELKVILAQDQKCIKRPKILIHSNGCLKQMYILCVSYFLVSLTATIKIRISSEALFNAVMENVHNFVRMLSLSQIQQKTVKIRPLLLTCAHWNLQYSHRRLEQAGADLCKEKVQLGSLASSLTLPFKRFLQLIIGTQYFD